MPEARVRRASLSLSLSFITRVAPHCVNTLSLSLSLIPFRSLNPNRSPFSQDRFMREGAKSLIWNQHSLGLTSDFPESLEA